MDKLLPRFHSLLATEAINKKELYTPYPLLKTVNILSPGFYDDDYVDEYLVLEEYLLQLPPPKYSRLKRTADILRDLNTKDNACVIDIGGGGGHLSHFIPEMDYFLCDPKVNSLYSDDVMSMKGRFDFVVCTHTLEHIPKEDRSYFVAGLLSLAKVMVLLIGPIEVDGFPKNEGQELVYEHTKAPWALEHRQCIMPTRDDVLSIARELCPRVHDFPGSNYMATFLSVFLHQIVQGSHEDWIDKYYKDIKSFVNRNYHLLKADSESGDHVFLLFKS